MHLHVYHEGVGKKGANNVASLIMKTLKLKNLLKPSGETGGELNIIFDNCTGQNKNNTVLKLMVWLTEMGYFKTVNFVFLIVGHTKNAADRIFNLIKLQYRKRNLFTFAQLTAVVATSEHDVYETHCLNCNLWFCKLFTNKGKMTIQSFPKLARMTFSNGSIATNTHSGSKLSTTDSFSLWYGRIFSAIFLPFLIAPLTKIPEPFQLWQNQVHNICK